MAFLKRKRSTVFTDSSDESHPNSTPVYRNTKSPRTLTTSPAKDVKTIYDIVLRGFTTAPDREMFGQRQIINIIEEEKEVTKKVPGGGEVKEVKKWQFYEMGPYEWMTWGQAEVKIHCYGSGLRALGLKAYDKVTIYADTSRDWMFTAMACMEQSITITTAYATLGEEGLTYSLQECEISTIVTNAQLLPMILKIASTVKTVKNVIYNGKPESKILDMIKSDADHLRVLSLDELEALGNQKIYAPLPPKAEDLALIMYTSGSTGPPKGVMLTHANVVASVSGSVTWLENYTDPINGELYLGYLPLAHILEFAAEMAHLFMGTRIGYGSVKTLTDASVRNCTGAIRELRPTLFAGVPAVWEGIRKAVNSKVEKSSPVAQAIFDAAYFLKSIVLDYSLPSFLNYPLDAIVFNKIKDQVGGRVKFSLSGGAPMPKSTQRFMNIVNAPLVSGYGMTECTAVLALQEVSDAAIVGMTGAPVTAVEVKLVDVENTNYKSTNVPKPQGEVWVRGPSVMKGYYKQEQLTRETITEEGWLMTGDIAEMNGDGTLSIIDRKKNLVKLSNGEYIALEKLESNYKVSKYVQNICVYADSEQSYAIAFIQPIEKEIRALAGSKNIHPGVDVDHLDYEALCARKDITSAVLSSLKDVAKSIGLKPAEVIGQVYLTPEEWTPQNEMLTAAMKLQRKVILNKYKDQVKKMYTQ
ncbi:UNVERIFIED_CONTAM: long-chain fatty acid-CoA ligase [Siphonaria sp. JEL0065]|nr:long-chain fatty acid-CoA ligase [Siphonaria sp. JEL0065]